MNEPNASSLAGAHILAVDDRPETLNILVDLLSLENAKVQTCQSGEEALEYVTNHKPDIILLDVSMPGLDGFETCRRLKNTDTVADVPVIFITAESEPEKIEAGFEAGGVDYVTKPFNLEKIVTLLRSHLQYHTTSEPSEETLDHRPDADEIIDALLETRIFTGLNHNAIRPHIHEMEWLSVPAGRRLIRQGAEGKAIYFVISGRLGVWLDRGEGYEDLIAEIGRGECVGELSILTNGTATANVDAIRDSIVIQLPKDAFDRMVASEFVVLQNVNQLLIQRIKNQNQKQAQTHRTNSIALIPTHPSVPIADFARHLTQSISQYVNAICINADVVDEALGEGSAQAPEDSERQRKIVNWLNTQESQHQILIYEADLNPSAWSLRCIRQADHILIVGWTDEDPTPGAMEEDLNHAANLARRDLILLHPEKTVQPQGTARWLEKREVSAHYHVRFKDDNTVDRLSRILTARTVNLVLSGGSSRGFAHIGIIRALTEHNIPIDFIGGASVGSVVAAQFALGQKIEDLAQGHKKWWVDKSGMHQYTLPWMSLASDRVYNVGLQDILGLSCIEDLWITFFAVSTNITRGDLHVHKEGPIWEACRASTSMPAYYPPFYLNGDLFVDGGVLDNIPINVMRNLNDGFIFASDVSTHSELEKSASHFKEKTGWNLLANRLNPFSTNIQVPSIPHVLFRTLEVGMGQHKDHGQAANLCFYPPVQEFSWFDAKPIYDIIDAGYQHACDALEQWDKEGKLPKI